MWCRFKGKLSRVAAECSHEYGGRVLGKTVSQVRQAGAGELVKQVGIRRLIGSGVAERE